MTYEKAKQLILKSDLDDYRKLKERLWHLEEKITSRISCARGGGHVDLLELTKLPDEPWAEKLFWVFAAPSCEMDNQTHQLGKLHAEKVKIGKEF